MAKDVSNKSASNTTNNTSPPISDQQKVPPLRIVLNTSGNQKSSSTAVAVTTNPQQQQEQNLQQQTPQELKREKTQDARADGAVKSGGRVRIKLGTNKQASTKGGASGESSADKSSVDDAPKGKVATVNEKRENTLKEEINANHGHLRRITRRSQRSMQTVSNEDEESISSMTSTDENQNTTNNNNSDNNSGQDATNVVSSQPNANSSNAQTNSNSSTTNTSSSTTNNNAETPRRYKRRKGETSESQLSELDGLFGFHNYKLPVQNSFELYRNIRKQVDKKLKSLNIVHPKTPYGFRDYMLTRGAYLLDGNKLGNGTNLSMNEDGGLHPAPSIGKYHALHRNNRVIYSVPNGAKVPLCLSVNSPLYNLFIEQEKERYRMRMQHIKEREKLTLAAEQEIVRVYNQAAMAAANQLEPFSACTMLKHQEIYNYIDSDGVTIQSSEDDQLDDQIKQEGVRTRRRHHEAISPAPSRKSSNAEDATQASEASQQTKDTTKSPPEHISTTTTTTTLTAESQKDTTDRTTPKESLKDETTKVDSVIEVSQETGTQNDDHHEEKVVSDNNINLNDESSSPEDHDKKPDRVGSSSDKVDVKIEPPERESEREKVSESIEKKDTTKGSSNDDETPKTEPLETPLSSSSSSSNAITKDKELIESSTKDETASDSTKTGTENEDIATEQDQSKDQKPSEAADDTAALGAPVEDCDRVVPMEQDISRQGQDVEPMLSDDDRRAYNKEVFLSQLQDIDDKWDRIRSEMLIRHKNEAESLHAVQRLEWEWKTKEIGACDVRTTPIIDNTLVPKLNIYSQDY